MADEKIYVGDLNDLDAIGTDEYILAYDYEDVKKLKASALINFIGTEAGGGMFYLGEGTGYVTIGNYSEWLAAGSPKVGE